MNLYLVTITEPYKAIGIRKMGRMVVAALHQDHVRLWLRKNRQKDDQFIHEIDPSELEFGITCPHINNKGNSR